MASSKNNKILTVIQTIGRSFFLPISILPVAGLLLGIGASFSNMSTVQQYGLESIMGTGTLLNHMFLLMSAVGNAVFANLPLLFALAVAMGMAKEEKAVAVLSAALEALAPDVCYFGLRMTGDKDGAVFTDDLPLRTPLTLPETPALLLNRPSACIAAWRRTLFTDTDIRFRARGWGEDLCMTRKMLTAARSVVILPDVLYLYRQHEGSVTKRALDANAEIMDAIDDVLTWYQARGLFEQYENELGKLCVDNVLYDASVRILKAQSAHPLLPQLLDFTAARFPDYRHNPYLKGYPARKKLVLSLLGKKQYRAVHMLFAAAGH